MTNIEQSNSATGTPKAMYLALAGVCVGAGAWASIEALKSIKYGMAVLETNPAMLALTDGRSTMFMVVGLVAWFIVGLLKGNKQLKAHRMALQLFASAVLALEIATIAGVSLSSAMQTNAVQQQIEKEENELLGRIKKIEADADVESASAQKGRELAKNAWELQLAAKSNDKATATKKTAEPLYAELKALRATKHTTLTQTLGEQFTTIYSIAQGVLMSLGGTFFFSKAGALLRLAATQSTHQQPQKPAGTRPVQPRSILQRIFSTLGSVWRSLPPLRRSGSKS